MMWEMIERMATDRLWIYTAIAGSLFGAAFLAWFQGTRIGLWAYRIFDNSTQTFNLIFQLLEDAAFHY